MGLSHILLLALLAAQPNPNMPARLDLQASTLQPYVGEEVELRLEIELNAKPPPGQHPKLTIHWLTADFGWSMPFEKWRQSFANSSSSDPFLLNNEPAPIYPERLRADPKRGYHYVMTWKLVTPPVDEITEGRLNFSPVKLTVGGDSCESPPLSLQVRAVPPPLKQVSRINLGVGNFAMAAEVKPDDVLLGGDTLLTLKVRGRGALQSVPAPKPVALAESLKPQDFVLEPAGESWDPEARVRSFNYRLRPRRTELNSVPRIAYTCFDPGKGEYLSRATEPVPLRVRAGSSGRPSATRPNTPGETPARLSPIGDADELLQIARTWPNPWILALLVVVPPLMWAGLLVARWRVLRFNLGRRAGGLSAMAGRALGLVRRARQPEELAAIFTEFVRKRFPGQLAEPTCEELAESLARAGVPPAGVDQAVAWWRACSAARFGSPDAVPWEELKTNAALMIQRLDACP